MNYKVTKCISKQDTEKPRTALKLCFLKKTKTKTKEYFIYYLKKPSSTLKMVGWLVHFIRKKSNLIPPLETFCVLMPIFTTYRQEHFNIKTS